LLYPKPWAKTSQQNLHHIYLYSKMLLQV
jgi:hypothetical protein